MHLQGSRNAGGVLTITWVRRTGCVPRCTRWSLNNGAARRLTRYRPAVYFPDNNSNEVETADGNPILFDAGEPYTIALLILWT